jgi:hypothetical protein
VTPDLYDVLASLKDNWKPSDSFSLLVAAKYWEGLEPEDLPRYAVLSADTDDYARKDWHIPLLVQAARVCLKRGWE